jgi:hypothetical protein
MTQGKRLALIAAVVVIAIVAFIVLKPDDKKDTASTAGTTSQATTTAQTPPPVTQIRVVDGKPDGGIKEIDASKGDQIRFTVSSDVSDEIHVHGYDLMKDVKAGGKVSFSFPAKIDGEFEIELENAGEQIAQLVVNP